MAVISNVNPTSNALTVTGLATLAIGAYSQPSSFLDNTSSTLSYLTGWIRLSFSSALTAGSSSPFVTCFVFEARDGTSLPTPPAVGGTVAPSPNARQFIVQLNPSATFQVLDFPVMDLGPFQTAFSFFNGSGVAFTGASAVCYRGNIQSV